jgi:hypothetical protein
MSVELYSNFILLMLIFLVGPYELLGFIGDITIYKNSWDPDLLNKSSQKCQEMMENVTVMVRFRFFLYLTVH